MFSIAGDIWRVNTDGSGLRPMVRGTNGGAASAPDIGPDGRQLAYVEGQRYVVIARDLAADSLSEIRRVDLFDKNPLTPTGADNLDMGPIAVHWSPDGTQLLVTRQRLSGSGMSDVLLMSADGSDRKTLVSAGAFIEATWSISRAPVHPGEAPSASIVVVDGGDGLTGTAYDRDGNRIGGALPLKALRYAVTSRQRPMGDGVLITSSAGSPEPFGPIEVIDVTGASRIVAGGCGAVWSPEGNRIAYYDGAGVAISRFDAESPDDRIYAVRSEALGAGASSQSNDACSGVGVAWRRGLFTKTPE